MLSDVLTRPLCVEHRDQAPVVRLGAALGAQPAEVGIEAGRIVRGLQVSATVVSPSFRISQRSSDATGMGRRSAARVPSKALIAASWRPAGSLAPSQRDSGVSATVTPSEFESLSKRS